jgi:hypothetical protein
VGHLQPKRVITAVAVAQNGPALTEKGKVDSSKGFKAGVFKPGLGSGSNPPGNTPPAPPTITQPAEGAGFCNGVPFGVMSTAPPADPIVALELDWGRYKGQSCGPKTSNACWADGAPANWDGVKQQAQINTTIARSAFPKKALWRVRAKAKSQSNLWSAFTNWRQFRVKAASNCP